MLICRNTEGVHDHRKVGSPCAALWFSQGHYFQQKNSSAHLYIANYRCSHIVDSLWTLDCTGNNPENGFSLWRLIKSCVSYKLFHIAFLFSPLPFLSRLASSIDMKLVTKNRPILHR